MNVNVQSAGGFLNLMSYSGLKSVQQKQERQEKCASQIAFFEKQKENLKDMQCNGVDEIAKKLDMLHSYEDQIAAAKKEYNNSQMMHVMDEAQERGEKMAEAAKKYAPKTEEERREELLEEAMGTEESGGMLEEIMDEMSEAVEETAEENLEDLDEALKDQEQLENQEVLEGREFREEPGVFEPRVFQDMAGDERAYRHIDYKV